MSKTLNDFKKDKVEIQTKMDNALRNGKMTNYISLKSRLDAIELHILARTQKPPTTKTVTCETVLPKIPR